MILEKIKIAISIELKNNNLSINYITISDVRISKGDIYRQNISKDLISSMLLRRII